MAIGRGGGLAGGGRGRHNVGVVDLVLASASPRRADLLRAAGLTIEVRPVDCDETPHPGEDAVDYARRIAGAKLSAAVSRDGARSPTLAADTVVWSHRHPAPLGKPRDREHARAMLESLLGQAHRVTTAWTLLRPGAAAMVSHQTTHVWMRPLSAALVSAYLDSGEWRDKAGGYGIQGRAAGWVNRIEGSYTNVVGLPLAQVLEALDARGGPS